MMNRREMLRNTVVAASALAISPLPKLAYGIDYMKPVEASKGLRKTLETVGVKITIPNWQMRQRYSGTAANIEN